ATGLPHRRMESWHYTDLRTLMRRALPLAAPPGEKQTKALGRELAKARLKQRLVLADGFFVPGLSTGLPPGVGVRSLAPVLAEGRPDLIALLAQKDLAPQDPAVALNAALMQDGVVVEIAPGAKIAEPIHLVHVSASPSPAASYTRSILVLGAGSSVHFAESYRAANMAPIAPESQINSCLILCAGDGATLSHTAALIGRAPGRLQIETVMARLGSGAKLDSFALTAGPGLLRRQIFLRFEGAGAQAAVSGVSLLRGREHADSTLRIEHAAQACLSRESFRYVLDEEATGVFQGRIIVAPEAQKTDGKMLCKSILLSDLAAMNSKPELEIFADDVACGHGATCGGLDPEQLFYLRTRGLAAGEAEGMLLEGFAGELVEAIPHKGLAAAFREDIGAWLSGRNSPKPPVHSRGSGS
ncbi:MAG: SufD family Fe-S cluster assembly protein, partial [Methylocapsa sp.]|nr:SufD family Fe-S cluster assembly protein [Methylocapsa sp.]